MLLDIITNYFYPIAIFQSVLMTLFLFNQKKGSQKQNRLLALFFLSFGVMIGSRFFISLPKIEIHSTILAIGANFRFFIGPLMYLYLRSIFDPSSKLRKRDLLHAGLFVFLIINIFTDNYLDWLIYIYLDVVQILVYLIWSFFKFKLINLFLKPVLLKLDTRHVLWLQIFVISNIATLLILVFLLLFISKLIYIPDWDSWYARITAFSNFVFINSIVYLALKLPDLFISIKYKNGELPYTIQQRYITKLKDYMNTQKPYLNPELSLNSLADEISISPKHLSQIINDSLQQNFYHFINSYRIEECKKLLSDEVNNKDTILSIAFKAGFNSKNTFNTAFKINTGMTPTEFQKYQNQN